MGVDPSSKKLAGVASPLDGSDPIYWHRVLPNESIEVRCLSAYKSARAVIRRIQREFDADRVGVFMEAPLVGRGGVKTTVVQSKVQGAVLAGFISAGAEWAREANASRTKKQTIGKGNADKADIMLWVEETYPDIFEDIDGDQDLADACMHWHAGLEIARKAKL